jgi:hypothetical protein
MIAAGHDVDAALKEFGSRIDSDARAPGGVFAIGNNQVNLMALAQLREKSADGVPTGLAHDVANKKKLHVQTF